MLQHHHPPPTAANPLLRPPPDTACSEAHLKRAYSWRYHSCSFGHVSAATLSICIWVATEESTQTKELNIIN